MGRIAWEGASDRSATNAICPGVTSPLFLEDLEELKDCPIDKDGIHELSDGEDRPIRDGSARPPRFDAWADQPCDRHAG